MKDTILYGDCRNTLKTITEKCQMCVTSPPYYGLRNYGNEDDQIGMEVFTHSLTSIVLTCINLHLGKHLQSTLGLI